MVKEKFGIIIHRSVIFSDKKIRREFPSKDSPNVFEIEYRLELAKFNPLLFAKKNKGIMFVTNKSIDEVVKKHFKINNTQRILGEILTRVYPTGNLIEMYDYHPLSGDKKVQDFFKGNGIAVYAERRIEQDLNKNLPGFNIVSSKFPSKSRKQQLIKRGRKIGIETSINNALQLTKKQIRKTIYRLRK